MKSRIFCIVTCILLCMSSCGLLNKNSKGVVIENKTLENGTEYKSLEAGLEEESEEEDCNIFVFVCGEVNVPGVYEMKSSSRVYEAIELAGGLTEEADIDAVNQAEELEDGRKLFIPNISDSANEGSVMQNESSRGTQSTLININTATKEQLMTLPGIGESKANMIISYREKNGKFKDIKQIKDIEGIKDGVFNKIEEFISVY